MKNIFLASLVGFAILAGDVSADPRESLQFWAMIDDQVDGYWDDPNGRGHRFSWSSPGRGGDDRVERIEICAWADRPRAIHLQTLDLYKGKVGLRQASFVHVYRNATGAIVRAEPVRFSLVTGGDEATWGSLEEAADGTRLSRPARAWSYRVDSGRNRDWYRYMEFYRRDDDDAWVMEFNPEKRAPYFLVRIDE